MLIRLLNDLAFTAPVTQRYFQHITNMTYITGTNHQNSCRVPLTFVRLVGKKELLGYFITFYDSTPVIALAEVSGFPVVL